MNCKPGDLAVIVNDSFEENIGALVTVLNRVESGEWLIRSEGRKLRFFWQDNPNEGGFDLEVELEDSGLRPIRGEPVTEERSRENIA